MERKPPGCSYEMNGTVRLVTLSLNLKREKLCPETSRSDK